VQKKEIHYNDSMANAGTKYLNAAMQWLVDEGKEKKGIEVDKQEWRLVSNRTNVPQQANGFDCGVFSVVNADFASDNLAFEYAQRDMDMFRQKICASILRGKLDYAID
jgi:sentrin-specific protease 1